MSSESDDSSEIEDPDRTEENIIKILVAGDINLGYEKSTKRDQEDDSFRTFEEILQHATNHEVDAVLLAGNLFYEAHPTLNVITKCINLLRKYCLGQKPVKIDCLTDPDWIFEHCHHKTANFKDPNLNIKMPIFSIRGHRDTPVFDSTGSLDLLAATGLVNYFGKWPSDEILSISPVLLRKGITTAALYGLNHMNDKKLSKLIKNRKFEILQDSEISDVFNVLVLHQNRARRNRTEDMYLSETLIPNYFNLVVWGHEPVCRIKPDSYPNKSFAITQPGSCIATSLIRGETIPKHVAVLKIYKSQFAMQCMKLKTVRPFVYNRINLNQYDNEINNLRTNNSIGRLSRPEAVEHFIDKYIEKVLLPAARKKETEHPKQPKKPLLRLKILCNNNQDRFNPIRLSKKYWNAVLNPESIILFLNHSEDIDLEVDDDNDDYEELSSIFFEDETQNWNRTIEGGILDYYNQDNNKEKLNVLTLDRLNEALEEFKNNDHKAFERAVREQIQEVVNHLMDKNVSMEDAMKAIKRYREE